MKRRILSTIIISAIVLVTSICFALGYSVSAADDSYIDISSESQLSAMSENGNYRLVADITVSGWKTVDSFSGKLDGNGKSISGLTAPLFSVVSGEISDLTLKGSIDISGERETGAFAEKLSGGKLAGCVSYVQMSGSRAASAISIGGLVGTADNGAVIEDCVNNGDITITGAYNEENGNAMGAVVGYVKTGCTVSGCVNNGTIFADGNGNTSEYRGALSGIVGIANGSVTIEKCLNAGEVKAVNTNLCVGGILGRTSTGDKDIKVIYCANTGKISKTSATGSERIAGIVSYIRGGYIGFCYNTGTLESDSAAASGILGYYNGSGENLTMEYNYSAGTFEGSSDKNSIAHVNGTGKLKSVGNLYLTGVRACNQSLDGATECKTKAELSEKAYGVDGFCSDMPGAGAVNDGYPILFWQCDHSAFGEVVDAQIGIVCSNCGTFLRENECEHSFGEWVTVKEATATESGLKKRECSKCGAVEEEIIPATTSVQPVDGVYNIENASQLIWLAGKMNDGSVGKDISIKLNADIDVGGKLPMITGTFAGTLDGGGHEIAGISQTLFNQFNGYAFDLTLKGNIDYTSQSIAFDTARKAASFALNAEGAQLSDIVSEVNITASRNDLNAGGIVGYSRAATYIRCEYSGDYNVEWTGDGGGVGGIVGWSNSSGGTTVFEECSFTGTITVSAGASGKEIYVGGILGNCTNATVNFYRCVSDGKIESSVSAGSDYAGGIVGVNKASGTSVSYCINRSGISSGTAAAGILGYASAATSVTGCANYSDKIESGVCGAVAGRVSASGLVLTGCMDFSGSGAELSGGAFTNNRSFESSKIKDSGRQITLNGKKYNKYNVCYTESDTGILVNALSAEEMFEPFISVREEDGMMSVRFVILADRSALKMDSVDVSIVFKDEKGNRIKGYDGTLSTQNSDFSLYAAVVAGNQEYFAAEDSVLFGLVITDIPSGAWESAELSISDSTSGEVYLEPVICRVSELKVTLDELPSYTSLGKVASTVYNAGPGLESDQYSVTDEDSYMAVISSTTASKLKAYVESLSDYGFTFVSENTIDGDTYYTYRKYGTLFYFYHTSRTGMTRIIADNSSDLISEINYDYSEKAGDTTEFYQYSINYTNANRIGQDPVQYSEPNNVINCGMLYIIKLPDNKLIIVDGGHESQSTKASRKGLMDFMRKITGKADGEKVDIAMWFFTHAHGDHVRLASDFLTEYRNDVILESVTYNFPSYQVVGGGYDSNTFTLKNTLNTYYSDVLYHKLHTGEVLSLAGVKMEVVYTHEDAVNSSGGSRIGDFNSTSTVLKIYMDGKSIMLLGDTSDVAEDCMIEMHTPGYFKSDIVQVAHHCFNYLNDLYPLIDADIAVFPQSMYNCKNPQNDGDNLYKYQSIMKYSDEEYFAHKYTYRFTVNENGEIEAQALPRYDAE